MEKIIHATTAEEARRLIERQGNAEKIMVLGREIGFNRKILETKKVSVLVLSHKEGKDSLKQRNSGLNQVLCKIAKENSISLAIDFHELQEPDKRVRAKILSRIIQNIKLAKKHKNNLIILNKPKDKLSLSAFLCILGADTKLAKIASEN